MKFIAIPCPLLQNSPGAALIRSYQRKRDLTSQYMKTKKAQRRRQALIAEKTKEYFEERTRDTNASDYVKFQLDNARAANEAAIVDVVNAEPGPSSSYVQKLRRAYSTSLHLHETLEDSHTRDKHSLDLKIRSTRMRRKSIQTRNKSKNVARSSGTEETVRQRQELSYGKLSD